MSTATEVVIWQHPKERDHAKGSAQLLHLCLPNSRLVVGEQLSAQAVGVDAGRCALLYPTTSGAGAPLSPARVQQLLLLDGTWRKSRRMMYLNPWLQHLPRIALAAHTSAYSIRRAEQNDQLSTFEAAVAALKDLEHGADLAPLEFVFVDFIQQLQRFRPR